MATRKNLRRQKNFRIKGKSTRGGTKLPTIKSKRSIGNSKKTITSEPNQYNKERFFRLIRNNKDEYKIIITALVDASIIDKELGGSFIDKIDNITALVDASIIGKESGKNFIYGIDNITIENAEKIHSEISQIINKVNIEDPEILKILLERNLFSNNDVIKIFMFAYIKYNPQNKQAKLDILHEVKMMQRDFLVKSKTP
jgi:hypothetical protein